MCRNSSHSQQFSVKVLAMQRSFATLPCEKITIHEVQLAANNSMMIILKWNLAMIPCLHIAVV